jgi:hypothetical protein
MVAAGFTHRAFILIIDDSAGVTIGRIHLAVDQ